MPRHRTHSLEFKRQVARDYVVGETLHRLTKRHDLPRTYSHRGSEVYIRHSVAFLLNAVVRALPSFQK
jgi:hypothetical protein